MSAVTLALGDIIGWAVALVAVGLVAGAVGWDCVRTWTGRRR